MSFEIIPTDTFERKLKRLAKKHKSLKNDLTNLVLELSENPTLGDSLGKECYKVRLRIESKGKGKSGGARLITFVRVVNEIVFLIDIYDKAEQSTISNKRLTELIELLGED